MLHPVIGFEHGVPGWAIGLGVLSALAATVWSARRYLPRDGASLALMGLRAAFLALLAWCLFMPQRKESLTRVLKPRFVVAVDVSRSMSLTPSPEVPARWAVVRDALDQPWTQTLRADCDIDLYGFASGTGPRLDLAESAALKPDGDATLLRDAMAGIEARYRGQNVAGVLVLSDGLDTREAFTDWASDPRPWPVYTLRPEPRLAWQVEPDVRVDGATTPHRVTVGWKTEIKAAISGQGTGGGDVNIQLYRNAVLWQERPVRLPDEGGSRDVVFQLEHPETGAFRYDVIVPPLPRESNTNDNAYSVSVLVVDTKNRLLYVDGPPRWESKFLNRVLKANNEVTPVAFVRGADGRFLSFGTTGELNMDMTEPQLALFKIVILGNLDAGELGAARAQNLLAFVASGGSLVVLGGSKAWGGDGVRQTVLQGVLPVAPSAPAATEGRFPVHLTDAGRAHPAFAGGDGLWDIVPPVLSVFPASVAGAGTEVLVEASTPAGTQPVVATQRYGQGRVVAILTDSLWRWQLDPAAALNKPYQRFWDQLLAWLTPAEEDVGKDRLELFADRDTLFLGEQTDLRARLGSAGSEAGGREDVRCEVESPDGRRIPFLMRAQHVVTPSGKSFPGYALSYTAQLPGLHKATAFVELDGAPLRSDPVAFFVKPFTPESVPRPADLEVLQALARGSGGAFCETTAELNTVLGGIRPRQAEEQTVNYRSLWQNVGILACLLTLLAIDWIVRKARNMP